MGGDAKLYGSNASTNNEAESRSLIDGLKCVTTCAEKP